jgi:hypothetical protein
MPDELGHPLSNISYAGLDRRSLVPMVGHCYDGDDFHPNVIFRIQHRPAFDAEEHRCVYHETQRSLAAACQAVYLPADLSASTAGGAAGIGNLLPMPLLSACP